jgi:predicted PurR-regulated permease PerM
MAEAPAPWLQPRTLLLIVVSALAAIVAWQLRSMLLLVLAAVLVGVLLRALVDGIVRVTRLGDGPALAIAVLLVTGVLAGLVMLLGAQLSGELQTLVRQVPDAWERVVGWLEQFDLERSPRELLYDNMPSGPTLLQRLGSAASLTAGTVANLAIVVVGGIYLAAQPQLYRRGVLRLVAPARRENAGRAFDALAVALRRWLLMQLAAMVIIGVITGLAMWALGMPSPLALGAIAGVLEFVPIVGPILAAIPALLLALAVSPEMVLWVALAYLVIQQVEGNVITPLLAQKVVDIPPALMLFALVGFTTLFGLLGGLLAAPMMVVLFVGVRELYVHRLLEGRPVEVPDK